MAHYPKIFDTAGGVTDIIFNDFFNGMTQSGTGPLLEGWYRITDYRTTGYVLDRFFSTNRVYGCQGSVEIASGEKPDISDAYNEKYLTPIEPIIVFVSFDPEYGWNRHNHRVYSEAYPEDEIYWTWDFGIKWDQISRGFPYTYDQGSSREWRVEDRFDYDATLFSPINQGYTRPLESIEPYDPYFNISRNESMDWKYWRGYIYRREDTERNIKGSYDWRNVYISRYSSQETLGDPWNASTVYDLNDFVRGDDNWLYVCLLNQNNINPILYDSFNDPLAEDASGNPLYAPSSAYSGKIQPSSAYAPLSSRRAWLRLWPIGFNWYSPWANGSEEIHGKVFYIGQRQLDPNTTPIQPSYIEIPCDESPKYFKTFSGTEDNVSNRGYIQNLTYVKNVDLGGPAWVPEGPEYLHPTNSKSGIPIGGAIPKSSEKSEERRPLIGGRWRTQFDSKLGDSTQYPKFTTHPVSNYDMMSYVTDNHIITFPTEDGNPPDPDNQYDGNDLGGTIDGLKFGENSAGNTLYVLPTRHGQRRKSYESAEDAVGIAPGSRPRKRHMYGRGWVINTGTQQIGGMNPDNGTWTNIDIIKPLYEGVKIQDDPYSFSEVDIWNSSNFGGNDFGSNFIGNVFFGCLQHSEDSGFYGYGYPRIDSWDLSETVDGVFCGNTFKNSNRYNIFLHGMKNCSIGSSEASIIETAADLQCKYSVNDFIRDIYGMKMDESRYNSIFHAVNIESSGLIAHNYLDSLYCSTMEDGFMYNNISMWLPIDAAYFDVPWPYKQQDDGGEIIYKRGQYFESGFNHFGPGFTLNTIRGWAISNDFRSQYTGNYQKPIGKPELEWPIMPTYLEYNSFGEGISYNYIWNAVKCTFLPLSIQGLMFAPTEAKLLNTDFAKTIRSSSEYDAPNNIWRDSGVPILNFIDYDGNKQLQKWNDNTTVIPFDFVTSTPTPCPNF
jgi:hypothetical protein